MKKRILSMLLMVTMLLTMLVSTTQAQEENSFSDVTEGDWFYDTVHYVVDKGYFDGMGYGLFMPNANMTRGMIVTVLWRIAGKPTASTNSAFYDVAVGSYYEKAVAWAADKGITNGTSHTLFSPDESVTRQMFATFLYRFAGLSGENTSACGTLGTFPDYKKVEPYAWRPLAWANGYGILTGKSGYIAYADKATRAEVATMIKRYDDFLALDVAQDYRTFLDGSSLTYDFANDKAGFAEGIITFVPASLDFDGYQLCWAKDDTTPRDDCTALYSGILGERTMVTTTIAANIAIPDGVKALVALNADGKVIALYDISQKKQFHYGPLQNTYGVLSDVHMGNRYNNDEDIPLDAFSTALNKLAKMGAEVIGISGDITTSGVEKELNYYLDTVSAFQKGNPNIPVYTSTGNHDTALLLSYETNATEPIWEWTTRDSENYTGSYTRENLDSHYDFTVDAGANNLMVYLNQVTWNYDSSDSDNYSPLICQDQFAWLKAILDANTDKNVMLFFHSYLTDTCGDATNGNCIYELSYNASKRVDAKQFDNLLKQYSNVVFFSGHSHWALECDQQYNYATGAYDNGNANVYLNEGGATYVHVPSVTSPRGFEGNSASRMEFFEKSSQGYLVRVYEDCIVLQGLQFKSGYGSSQKVYSTYYYIINANNS